MLSGQTSNSAHTWEVGEVGGWRRRRPWGKEDQDLVTVAWPAPDSVSLCIWSSPVESFAEPCGSFSSRPWQLCSASPALFWHQPPFISCFVQDKDRLSPGSQPKWPSALRRPLMRGVSRELFKRTRCPEQFLKRRILTSRSPLNTS